MEIYTSRAGGHRPLWFLNPERAIERNEPGFVEIVYLAESGPEAGSVEEAMRDFEAQSRAAHQENPAQPIYKIIKGQTASVIRPLIPPAFSLALPAECPRPDPLRSLRCERMGRARSFHQVG